LFAQMTGRGTRPLPGIVEHLEEAGDRIAAIRHSSKPALEVFDFVGVAGRHKLVSCADILGGKYDDAVVARAEKKVRDANEPLDVRKALDEAQLELQREQKEAARAADAATRRGLLATASYTTHTIDAFDVLDVMPERERGWHKGRKPSEKQIEMLRRNGIDNAAELSFTHASQLIQTIIDRRNTDRCTLKQARVLRRYGYSAELSFAEAGELMTALAANGWRPLPREMAGAVEGEL
jgi:type I site-specific restriction endonuclease